MGQLDALIQGCLENRIALFYIDCLEAAGCLNVYLVCLLPEALPSMSWTSILSSCYSESCSGIEPYAFRWFCIPRQSCLGHDHASLVKAFRLCGDGKWLGDDSLSWKHYCVLAASTSALLQGWLAEILDDAVALQITNSQALGVRPHLERLSSPKQ